MAVINLKVNGKKISKEVPDNSLLSDFLRENLALTGTHVGCDTSQCGACVIHLNGNSVKSCTLLVADCKTCFQKMISLNQQRIYTPLILF